MKKILFAAAAATLLFASCAKDGGNNGTVNNGKTGIITVTLKGSDVTRAAVDIDNGVTITAENASVFLVQGSVLVDARHLNSIGTTCEFLDVSTEVSAVYVIANAGDLVADGPNKIASWNDLLTRTHKLTQNASDKLILQGNSAITFANEGTGGEQKLVARPTVKLRPLAARIDVTVKQGTNPNASLTAPDCRLALDRLAVLYSAKENHYINQSGVLGGDGSEWRNAPAPGATVTFPYYYSGLNHLTDYAGIWEAAGNTEFYPAEYGSLVVKPVAVGTKETFYVYPGAGAHGRHTIVTVCGKWENELDVVENTFFSAHFKGMDTYGGLLPVVENGRFYTITITLNGDYNDEDNTGGGGQPDPEDEDEFGDIEIDLEDGEWIIVVPEIDVPFN